MTPDPGPADGAIEPSVDTTPNQAGGSSWHRARRFLSEGWDVYRRELLAVVPATLAVRVSVVLAATLLVEIPAVILHLLTDEPVLDAVDDDLAADVYVGALMATWWATLGHHFLAGILERVVAADRHGHERPGLRETFRHLPWSRLIVADIAITSLLTALTVTFLLPRLLVGPFLVCVMPLLSMRHENLRTVWRASIRLVRGSWLAVTLAWTVAVVLESVLLQGGAQLVEEVTHSHTAEILAHGALAVFILPFTALLPVIFTFDLLEEKGERPVARY